MKPLIGLICHQMPGEPKQFLNNAYLNSVLAAGGEAVILPLYAGMDTKRVLAGLDGLISTGGADVAPLLYGQEPLPKVTASNRMEDEAEMALCRRAMELHMPLFGICRGMQVINVALGGTLIQDIPSQTKNEICHAQAMSARSELTHSVALEKGSHIAGIMGAERITVNSFHHQSVLKSGEGMIVTGKSPDGVIEAMESADGRTLCVQWHPEALGMFAPHRALFEAFTDMCV